MAEKSPLISVIMPLYNAERFVGASIEQILSQTVGDFELIIIDDASTDSSYDIAHSYACKDERIILLRNEVNQRVAMTRNRGLDLVRGQFITFMDADDLCSSERFARQLDFFGQHPEVDLCGSYYTMFRSEKELFAQKVREPLTHEEIAIQMLFGCPFAMPSVMIRRAPFENTGIRFRQSMAEDYLLWAELSEHLRMANIPEYLFYYRRWENQISTCLLSKQTESAQAVQRELLAKHLGVVLTDDQSHAYTHLSLGSNDATIEELNTYRQLLKKILKANKEKPTYNSRLLRKKLLRHYKIACQLFYPKWVCKIKKRLLLLEFICS